MANPVGLIATGIAAATVALITFSDVMGENEDESRRWTDSTRQQYDELQNLTAEYEDAVAVYGETAEEALRLKYQVDDLTASFESNKQTIEDFSAVSDSLLDNHNKMMSSFAESDASIKDESTSTLTLIQRLSDLATASEDSEASQKSMQAIIQELNQQI